MEPSPYSSAAKTDKIISEITQTIGPTCELESKLAVTAKDFIVYSCGAHIVIYNTQLHQQVKYVSHRTHLISAIAVSADGSRLAVA